MIKTRSPYYLNIPFVSPETGLTCTSFTLDIYIWNGLKNATPEHPTYSQTIDNPTASTGSTKINISNILNSFINFKHQEANTTELINGNNQYWVSWQTYYVTQAPTDLLVPTNIDTKLFIKGYTGGMDGENATTPANKILLSGNEFKVSRDSNFILPIAIEETVPLGLTIILNTVTLDSGINYILNYTMDFNAQASRVDAQYKLTSENVWTSGITPGVGVIGTHNVTRSVDLTGSVDFRVRTFPSISSPYVVSNTITIQI